MKSRKKKGGRQARDLLGEVLKSNAEVGRENYTVVKDAGGAPLLCYEFGGELGTVAVLFDTQGFADYMVEACGRMADACKAAAVRSDKGAKSAQPRMARDGTRREAAEALAKVVMRMFISGLQEKLSVALYEYVDEVFLLAEGVVRTGLRKHAEASGLKYSDAASMQTKIKSLTDEMAKSRRVFLKGSLERIEGKPNFDRLKEHYERLRGIWEHAETLYKAESKHPRWREIIRVAEPEIAEAAADLLDRLSGRLNDLTPAIQSAVSRVGGNSTPASLALEHAARLCGAKPYQYTTRTLYRKLREVSGGVAEAKGVQ